MPLPHRHLPVAEQVSVRMGLQVVHATAPMPQEASVGGVQVEPEQQPFGQLAALHPLPAHTPLLQTPASHASHAPPADPHAAPLLPATHALPEQQPAHELGSQTQLPAAQR